MFETGRLGPLDWAVTGQALSGERVSGDDWLVIESAGRALIGAVDGLGHGDAAAAAARQAKQVVVENGEEPLDVLLERSHEALAGTRGAAMTLVRIDLGTGAMEWLGIGNVAAYLIRVGPAGSTVAEAALLRGGILGHSLPSPLRVRETAMRPGDLLLLGTDGLATGFEDRADLSVPTGQLVADLLEHCAKSTDDALILAARDRGPSR